MATGSEKELLQLQSRLKDLAEKSYRQNVYTHTGFLGLAQLDVYYRMEKELSFSHPALFGGYDGAERMMIRFGNPVEFGYEENFPIVCIKVSPLLAKFAENLSHRDFLGALMNLQIDRSQIGDILVGEKVSYFYCVETMADFICENLTQIKHTHIRCEITGEHADVVAEEPKEMTVLTSSLRADGCISKVYNLSRTDSLNMFQAGKVYINGRMTENNSYNLKENDVVNVRGYGKFVFRGVKYESKKGKSCLDILLYR